METEINSRVQQVLICSFILLLHFTGFSQSKNDQVLCRSMQNKIVTFYSERESVCYTFKEERLKVRLGQEPGLKGLKRARTEGIQGREDWRESRLKELKGTKTLCALGVIARNIWVPRLKGQETQLDSGKMNP